MSRITPYNSRITQAKLSSVAMILKWPECSGMAGRNGAEYAERQILYKKYAEITIDCNELDQEELAAHIAKSI
jgi:hypothetical protein